jgi:hypothetical protein
MSPAADGSRSSPSRSLSMMESRSTSGSAMMSGERWERRERRGGGRQAEGGRELEVRDVDTNSSDREQSLIALASKQIEGLNKIGGANLA